MEQENNTRLNKNYPAVWITIISIVVTALVIGGIVYVWQFSNLQKVEQDWQKQITSLQNQLDILQVENKNLKEAAELSTSSKSLSATDKIKFPVVVYGRAGLLNDIEKKKLEEKLINPYTDYHNEDRVNLIALYITVPQNIGEVYTVDAIFGNGGYSDFLFGKREQEYGYWYPKCLGPCGFSETFKKKYPQIAQ